MTTLHTRIAVRAYFAWEAAGYTDGQHEAHWLAAEREEKALYCGRAAASIRAIEDAKTTKRREARRAKQVTAFAAKDAARAAEIEATKAEKRRAAALKGAATRKANREAKREAAPVMVAILGRSMARDGAAGVTAY